MRIHRRLRCDPRSRRSENGPFIFGSANMQQSSFGIMYDEGTVCLYIDVKGSYNVPEVDMGSGNMDNKARPYVDSRACCPTTTLHC